MATEQSSSKGTKDAYSCSADDANRRLSWLYDEKDTTGRVPLARIDGDEVSFVVCKSRVVIGRHSQRSPPDIGIVDRGCLVSRAHLELQLQANGRWTLLCNGKNGIFVDSTIHRRDASVACCIPDEDINELAEKLDIGEYKLLHYHSNPAEVVPTAPPVTGQKIANAIRKHGYYYVNRSDYSALFDRLIEEPSAVMVKASTFADVYAMLYPNRSKLWRIADQVVSSSPLSYLWRKDFPLSEQINQAIVDLGNGKVEILRRKIGYSTHQVHNNPMLLGSTYSESDPIKLSHVAGPLAYLLVCIVIALVVLFIERFWERRGEASRRFRFQDSASG